MINPDDVQAANYKLTSVNTPARSMSLVNMPVIYSIELGHGLPQKKRKKKELGHGQNKKYVQTTARVH